MTDNISPFHYLQLLDEVNAIRTAQKRTARELFWLQIAFFVLAGYVIWQFFSINNHVSDMIEMLSVMIKKSTP